MSRSPLFRFAAFGALAALIAAGAIAAPAAKPKSKSRK